MQWPAIILLAAATLAVLLLLGHASMPLGGFLRSRRKRKEQAFWEDVLRQILLMKQEKRPVSEEALAGSLGRPVSTIRRVLLKMSEHGLVQGNSPEISLSKEGERWALHILRAHRLWESYLADEARLPMERVHHLAEEAEHRLSKQDLEALDAQLGHPLEDPHGDPIPSAEGIIWKGRGMPLSHWTARMPDTAAPAGSAFPAEVRVIHVEDEPPEILEQILARGIRPGVHLRLVATLPGAVEAEVDGVSTVLPEELLANVEVEAAVPEWAADPFVLRLSQLETGRSAEVVSLSEAIRGFSRRRLMDFGVTRGARVKPVLDNPFGDPRAFTVRGATIGIRKEQAELIWVRQDKEETATADIAPAINRQPRIGESE